MYSVWRKEITVITLSNQLMSFIFALTISYKFTMSQVKWSIKHSNTMLNKPVTGSFGTVGRYQALLGKEINISIKLARKWNYEVF